MTKGGLFKRGKVWWARWHAHGKCFRVSTGKTSQRLAEAKLKELTAPFALADQAQTLRTIAAQAGDLEAQTAALAKSEALLGFGWRWFSGTTSRKMPRPATMRQYEVQWFRFFEWLKKHYPEAKTFEAVTGDIARTFIADIRKTRSGNTANKYLRFLGLVWEVVRTDGFTEAENPWKKIAPIEVSQHSRRELTIEELRTVCQSAQGDLRPLMAIGLYCGLRLGDACTLKWSEVDMERNVIRRIPSKSRKPKPVLIPIHPVLKAMLEELSRDDDYVLPKMAVGYLKHPSYVTAPVQRLFTQSGITTTAPGEKKRKRVEVGFHSMRHSFVSLSRSAGAPLAVVEAIVGHSNPAMTRHYSHIGHDAAASAVGLLPSVMSGEMPVQTEADAEPEPLREFKTEVAKLAKVLNQDNWSAVRKQLLTMARPAIGAGEKKTKK